MPLNSPDIRVREGARDAIVNSLLAVHKAVNAMTQQAIVHGSVYEILNLVDDQIQDTLNKFSVVGTTQKDDYSDAGD